MFLMAVLRLAASAQNAQDRQEHVQEVHEQRDGGGAVSAFIHAVHDARRVVEHEAAEQDECHPGAEEGHRRGVDEQGIGETADYQGD